MPEASNVAPNVGRELLKSQRLIEWQLKEILSEIRNRELTTEEVNSLSTAIAQELEKAPSNVLEPYEDRLAKELGEGWLQLPIEVQRLLIQAELLRSMLHKTVDADWAPVVLHYIRATETLLRRLGDKLDTQKLHTKLNKGYPLRKANIETFRTMFQLPQFAQLAGAYGVSDAPLMAELGPELDIVIRNYRNPVVHGAEPMSAVKVRELRKLLFGSKSQSGGLLSKVASLCTTD